MQTNDKTAAANDPLTKATVVARWLEDKQARDILGLDVHTLSQSFETMLIATARNVRHAQALADHLMQGTSAEGFELLGMEGYKSGQWILVDLNDVVVHIFQESVRGFFNLEGLWSHGRTVLHLQQPGAAAVEPGEED